MDALLELPFILLSYGFFVADDSLKKLYEWFDRLYDLPLESQQKQLDELEKAK